MRRLLRTVAAVVLAMSFAAPVAGQDEPAPAVFDAAQLEAACEANAGDAGDQELCLFVVHEFLVPGSGPAGDEETASEEPKQVVFGLKDTQDRDGMKVTPVKVNWNTKPTNMFSKPDKGMKFVSVLIQYVADEDGGSYSASDWDVSDYEGFDYDQPIIGAEPALGSGDIRPNKKIQGWVTFEVPKNAKWLEISQTGFFQDPLYWTIKNK